MEIGGEGEEEEEGKVVNGGWEEQDAKEGVGD